MWDDPEYLDDCLAIRDTDKGLLVRYEGEEVWLPKSKILEDSEVTEVGDEGILAIPRWLAEEKGLL